MDGPVGAALAAKLPPSGLVGLGYWELGFRQLTNNRHPITKVDDIAGLKIRVIQSPIYIDLFNALGANAVPMPFTELYTALETGAIDGQENPAPSILTAKLNEVQDYLTLTNHTYNPQIVMVSGKFWDKLNEDERKLLQEATLEARDYERAVSREQAGKAVEELKAEGMEVTELPPEEVGQVPREGEAGRGQVCGRDRPRADAAAHRRARRGCAARADAAGARTISRALRRRPACARQRRALRHASGAATTMYRPNVLKARLEAGESIYGAWVGSGSPGQCRDPGPCRLRLPGASTRSTVPASWPMPWPCCAPPSPRARPAWCAHPGTTRSGSSASWTPAPSR